jgi:hypothetical protein
VEKIDYSQLNNLLAEINKRGIPSDLILNLLDIESLAELNVKQYNYLLFLVKS